MKRVKKGEGVRGTPGDERPPSRKSPFFDVFLRFLTIFIAFYSFVIASGLEIVDFCDLNGPVLPQNPLEKVGGFAPHLFQWVLRWEGAV